MRLKVSKISDPTVKKAFNCDCGYSDKNGKYNFDIISSKYINHKIIEYHLCSCDKIYKLTDGKKWEFVNYDSCAYCLKTKDICNCGKEPELTPLEDYLKELEK